MDEHRLRRLVEVGRALVTVLDPKAVLVRLLDVARELTDARYAAIGVLDERRERLERFLTAGVDAETHRVVAGADQTIGTANLRFMAERIHATTVEVRGASHVAMRSHPRMTARLIAATVADVTAGLGTSPRTGGYVRESPSEMHRRATRHRVEDGSATHPS